MSPVSRGVNFARRGSCVVGGGSPGIGGLSLLAAAMVIGAAGMAAGQVPGPGDGGRPPSPTSRPVASPKPSAALPQGYLVVPFENASSLKALDWMSSALAVMLAEKLEAHPRLRPAFGPRVLEGLSPGQDLVKIAERARELGAAWVFAGSFARPNWKAEVSLRVYRVLAPSDALPTASLRLEAEVSGVGARAALLSLFDEQLFALLGRLGWTAEPEVVAQLRRRPVRDLYAFTLYGRALNLFYGLAGPRDLTQAIKILKRVHRIEPKFAEAHRLLGLVYLEAGDRARASSQYAYALDLRPGYFAALAGLTRLYRQDGQRARAVELAEKALEVRPYDVEVRETYGELLWENGQLDEALAQLQRVVALQPRHLAARRTLALIYAAKGATGDLAAELERVQALQPDDPEVRLDLASAYQRMGAHERAIAVYEAVLKQQPRNIQAWKFLGDCHRLGRDLDRAIAAYQRLLRLAPEDPRPYFLLGAVYLEAGLDTKAEQTFQDAQQFKRYLGEAWTNLGGIALRRGELGKATWYLSRAVVKSPTRPKAHYNYALLLSSKRESRDKALEELRLAGDLDPRDPEIRYLAGVILLRQGRLDEARAQFEETLKRRSDHADAKHNLALLLDLERRYGGEHSGVGAR